MNPAFDRNHFGAGAIRDRMKSAWPGNSAATGCFKTMYVTKQITTCGLCGALT
jgi:hypothetical protein